jgi:hypothetical protein
LPIVSILGIIFLITFGTFAIRKFLNMYATNK